MTDIATIHGTVSRVIDVPSQQINYLRVEIPIEHHAEATRLFYGQRVLVLPAGPAMSAQPFGVIVAARSAEPQEPRQRPRGAPAEPEGAPQAATAPAAAVAGRIRTIQKSEHPPGGKLSIDAARLCDELAFQRFAWFDSTGDEGDPTEGWGSGDVAIWLRDQCGIASRAALDHNPRAAEVFRAIFARYRDFLDAYPEHAPAAAHA